jgi:putative restriction endonuclease
MDSAGEFTSSVLSVDNTYTRDDLRALFSITDATLNTGVFRPKGASSVWLFVTEEKTSDRTQYRDRLEGDILHWQGQTSGRTDKLIIDHEAQGLELLIFFRKRKYEHPRAAFRYLGPYSYVSHSGGGPASFILKRGRSTIVEISAAEADSAPFDPLNLEDARQRVLRTITQRRGQKSFRDALIGAYDGKCAISGCSVLDVLEAAHISPYLGPETNKVVNGLLLRADLHTLFDCGLLTIEPNSMTVEVSARLLDSEYKSLHGRKLTLPKQPGHIPSSHALKLHHSSSAVI